MAKIPPVPHSVIDDVTNAFLQRAAQYETAEFMDLTREWVRVQAMLQASYDNLAMQIDAMRANGDPVTLTAVHRLNRFHDLLAQAKYQVSRFNKMANSKISDGQSWHIEQGINKAVSEIKAVYRRAATTASFDTLPARALNHMIGHLGDGSPLTSLIKFDYQDTANALANILVDSTAKGINPRVTASKMSTYMDGNLDRAMVIARTEQIRSFRTASVEEYIASGVVDGYERHCALSDRTCMACIALDGEVYTLEEQFSDHPDGRCFCTPHVSGIKMDDRPGAKAWFMAQSEEAQRSMMGAEKFDAWKSGKFGLSDLGVRSHSDVWGEQVRVASLSSLVGD